MKLVAPIIALPVLVTALQEEQLIAGIHDVICNSNVSSQQVCNFLGIHTAECETIWDGITLAEFCGNDNNLRKRRSVRDSLDRPEKTIQEMVADYKNRGTSYNSRSKRSIVTNPWSTSIIESINSYGCWCYFGADVGYGRGRSGGGIPANDMDKKCRDLQQGYYCMQWDFETNAESGTCDVTNVNYVSATAFALTYDDTLTKESAIWKACRDFNNGNSDALGNCESRACAVEGYFLLNVFDLFLSGLVLDPSLKHDLGNFDTSTCKKFNPVTKGQFQDFICCGQYPKRYWHVVRDGYNDGVNPTYNKVCCAHHYGKDTLGCCGGSTYEGKFYDPAVLQCCNDSKGTTRDVNMNCWWND